jgi:hypothetical protein
MAKFSFDLNCTNAAVSPNGSSSVTVTLEDVDKSDLYDLFEIDDFIRYYGVDKVLNEIGEEEARKHFNIPEE